MIGLVGLGRPGRGRPAGPDRVVGMEAAQVGGTSVFGEPVESVWGILCWQWHGVHHTVYTEGHRSGPVTGWRYHRPGSVVCLGAGTRLDGALSHHNIGKSGRRGGMGGSAPFHSLV